LAGCRNSQDPPRIRIFAHDARHFVLQENLHALLSSSGLERPNQAHARGARRTLIARQGAAILNERKTQRRGMALPRSGVSAGVSAESVRGLFHKSKAMF